MVHKIVGYLLLLVAVVASSDFDRLGYWCRPNLFHPEVKLNCIFRDVVVFENLTFAISKKVGRHDTGYGPSNHVEFLQLLTKGPTNGGTPNIAFQPAEDVRDKCNSHVNLMHVGPTSMAAANYKPGPLHHLIEDAMTSMFRLYEWNGHNPVATYNNFAPVQTLERISSAMHYNLHSAAFPVCVSYASTGFSEHFLSGQDCPLARRMRDFLYEQYGVEQNSADNLIISKPRLGFLKRSSRGPRGVVNVAELLEAARDMGFEAVELDLAKDFKTVLTEVRKVTVIVGMHGGAMHALRYLQDGTVFINLPTYQMHADFGWFYRRSAECTAGSVVEWSGPISASSQTLLSGPRPSVVGMRQRQWLRGQSAFTIPIAEWKQLLKNAASLGCHHLDGNGQVLWSLTSNCTNSSHYSTVSSDIAVSDPFLPPTKSEFKFWHPSNNSEFRHTQRSFAASSPVHLTDSLSFIAGGVLVFVVSHVWRCRR